MYVHQAENIPYANERLCLYQSQVFYEATREVLPLVPVWPGPKFLQGHSTSGKNFSRSVLLFIEQAFQSFPLIVVAVFLCSDRIATEYGNMLKVTGLP